jgi:protein-tyrosine kinase
MSIIERAAELLRSGIDGPMRQPASSRRTEGPGRGSIEQAAADIAARLPPTPSAAKEPSLDRRDRHAGAVAVAGHQVKVDRERLHAMGMITPEAGRTPVAESFRRIKRQILANIASPNPDGPPANLVMVTSAQEGEGKSYCAINLAISMALEVERTVLLVDADVAKASIPRAFGLQAEKGLMELLLDSRLDLAEVLWKTDIGSLTLLPAGSAHKQATELLASDAVRRLLRDMAERYPDRIVLFDSPPLLAASESGALASQVGQIVVVVESGRTSEATLKDALGRVDASKVAGLILNKVDGLRLDYGYDAYG